MDSVEYFRTLLSIPSPSWKEDGMSSFITRTMTSFGYRFVDDAVGNLLFFLPGAGERPMLASHMDTVPLALTPHVIETGTHFMTDGNTALGADNKATTAAMLAAAEKHLNACFLFTRAEEVGLQGSKKLTAEFFAPFRISMAFVPDAEGHVGTVITSAPGKDTINTVINGRTAHAGFSPESGRNAIQAAAIAISRSPSGRIDEETTCNIGMISGGNSTNTVPDRAEYRYEVRSLDDSKRNRISSLIISEAERAAEEMECTADIIRTELYSPYIIPGDSKAKATVKTAIEALGMEYGEKATSGGSDTNNIRALGIDAITLTSGYEHPHSTKERIEKAQLIALERLLSALAG